MKKFTFLLLLVFVVASFLTMRVHSTPIQQTSISGEISYEVTTIPYNTNFTDNGRGITGYDNNSGETHVIVPDKTEDGKPLTSISNNVINNNRYIEILEISEGITSLGWINLFNCPNLNTIILHATDPITTWTSILGLQISRNVKIYVPDEAYNQYRRASGWSQYRNQIYRLSTDREA